MSQYQQALVAGQPERQDQKAAPHAAKQGEVCAALLQPPAVAPEAGDEAKEGSRSAQVRAVDVDKAIHQAQHQLPQAGQVGL